MINSPVYPLVIVSSRSFYAVINVFSMLYIRILILNVMLFRVHILFQDGYKLLYVINFALGAIYLSLT